MIYSSTRRQFLQSITLASGAILAGDLLTQNVFAQETDSDEKLEILPYLQNPSPTEMTVCFLSTDASNVKVDYSGKNIIGSKSIDAKKLEIPKTNWTIWKARLKNLQPGGEYTYRVRYKEGKEEKKSETYKFKTFNWAANETSAIAFNDGHDKTGVIEELMKHVKPDDFEFSLILGDMWNDPNQNDNARRVFITMAGYVKLLDASNKPMMYVRGNHDTRGGFAPQLSYMFDLPNNNPESEFPDQNAYYEFQSGPVWFISPDAGEDGDKRQEIFKPYRQRQVSWLKNLFAKSPSAKAPWRIIPMHIPLYTPRGWDQPDALERWESILNDAKIDLMIAGHDHKPHFVPKGKTFNRKQDNKPQTPPYPVLVGGGPNMDGGEIGTVMLIKADKKKLSVRMLDTKGKVIDRINLKK